MPLSLIDFPTVVAAAELLYRTVEHPDAEPDGLAEAAADTGGPLPGDLMALRRLYESGKWRHDEEWQCLCKAAAEAGRELPPEALYAFRVDAACFNVLRRIVRSNKVDRGQVVREITAARFDVPRRKALLDLADLAADPMLCWRLTGPGGEVHRVNFLDDLGRAIETFHGRPGETAGRPGAAAKGAAAPTERRGPKTDLPDRLRRYVCAEWESGRYTNYADLADRIPRMQNEVTAPRLTKDQVRRCVESIKKRKGRPRSTAGH